MTVKLRRIVRDEISTWCDAIAVGFLDVPDPARYPFIDAVFDNQRCTAALDGNQMVGTYASFTTNVTLPGGFAVKANAVAGVTVLPTHRKQSILSSAMHNDLQEAKERDEPLAILFASEFPIYARFGFGVATEAIDIAIDTVGITFRSPPKQASGRTVELVNATDAMAVCAPVYESIRTDRAGIIDRETVRWQDSFGLVPTVEKWAWKGYVAVTRDHLGMVDGYVRYKGDSDWSKGRPSSTLVINELIAATPAAHYRLLEYLCTMAWVTKVTMEDQPVDDDTNLFVVDERRVVRSNRSDQLWARILDVRKVLTARTYESADRVTIEVVDDVTLGAVAGSKNFSGFAGGRYTLDATPSGSTCKRSKSKADVTIGVSELASIVFGGLSFASFVRAGRAEEHTFGSALRVDRLFRTTRAPWNPTHF